MMIGIIRSELLKMRHTFSLKLVFLAPVITVLIGYVLSPHDFQYSAYNWWYTMLLPIIVAMWSANTVIQEKNTAMQNIVCLPVKSQKLWMGKIAALSVLLLFSNMLLWCIASLVGGITAASLPLMDSFIGCMLLVLTYLWQLPAIAWLAHKSGYLFAVLASSAATIILSAVSAAKPWFMLNPFGIPARVVAPFFNMQPNGIPLENGSPLLDTGIIFPAIGISLSLAAALIWGCSKWIGSGGPSHA